MNFEYFIFLGLTGLLATGYKVAKSVNKLDAKWIIAETILSLIISLAIVPALMYTSKLSIQQGIGITAILTVFSNLFIKLLEKKIIKKSDEL